MASIGECSDTTEAVLLYEPQSLFLKPIAKLNISVQLPQLKIPGKSICNWEVMEKLKRLAGIDVFVSLRVIKSTLEFVRFEAETEQRSRLPAIIARLDTHTLKLAGFPDALKVRAAEAKVVFPTRHDWDSYFRDARHTDEMHYGERPDTIHLRALPSRWFVTRSTSNADDAAPSEMVLRQVFATFGVVHRVDIPALDPYRRDINIPGVAGGGGGGVDGIATFSHGTHLTFDAFIQFKEYVGFVNAMTALRGMKLMHRGDDGKAFTANIKVDFDRTKHLTDKAVKKRIRERDRMVALEREHEDRMRKDRADEERRKELERRRKEEMEKEEHRRLAEKVKKRKVRQKQRESRRKEQRAEQRQREEEEEMQAKIALEERKILIAQRKLETIRLLSELFNRIKEEKEAAKVAAAANEAARQVALAARRRRLDVARRQSADLVRRETELRNRILKNVRLAAEKTAERKREAARGKVGGVRLKSAVVSTVAKGGGER